ncbi:MAG: ArsR/SmtB family transcription factor [Candidatus Helarchaeota archaeon]
MKSGYLVSQLKVLELAGIVQNFIEKKRNSNQFSFYEITSYGIKLLEGIFKCYNLVKFEKSSWKDVISNDLINELELLFKGLSNKFRIELLLALYKEGALSFSNIVERTKKDKSSITKHLKKLEVGGLIQNFLKKMDDSDEYSFYEITKFGSKVIINLITSFNQYYQF